MAKLTYVCHELLACCPDVFGESCAEHHHLLMVGCCTEYFLDVAAHV